MSLLAAVFTGMFVWAVARRLASGPLPTAPAADAGGRSPGLPGESMAGGPGRAPGAVTPARGARAPGGWLRRRRERPAFQAWLSQAGAAVTPGQFWAVSAGCGAVVFVVLLGISRTPVVAALPAAGAAAGPYAYWSAQRDKQARARVEAWPDALRYLVGALGAGVATLHEGLEELARSGPVPLRAAMGRYVRMSGRLGSRQALEVVRAELADAVSDPVLLAFEGAVEEGTGTVLKVLADLVSQITADIQLAEKIRTVQTQSRAATWGCLVLPYAVLSFLCSTNAAYRDYFSEPLGLALVLLGGVMSLGGFAVARRLVRPAATSQRVFVTEDGSGARR